MISNIPRNRYPETRLRTEALDIILKNTYQKTEIMDEILDIIPGEVYFYVGFRYYSKKCFKI